MLQINLCRLYLYEKTKKLASGVNSNFISCPIFSPNIWGCKSEPSDRVDSHGEVGGKEGDDESHDGFAEKWPMQFRQDDVGDQSEDEEDVWDGATDRVKDARNADLH